MGSTVLDGSGAGSASAIVNTVFSNGVGDAGDISLKTGSLSLWDGGLITSQLAPNSQGNAGEIAVNVLGDVEITGEVVDKTLPDAELETPPVVGKVDVFFLADNTLSMEGVINAVKSNAADVLAQLSGNDPRFSSVDIASGVGAYAKDPLSENSDLKEDYTLIQAISKDLDATELSLLEWGLKDGGDIPEGNFFALHQVATEGETTASGVQTGLKTGWRDGTERIILWFGDAPSHETTVSQSEIITTLVSNDVRIAAINTESAGAGIDSQGQASTLVAATGGSLQNNINISGVGDTILNAVDEALFPDYSLVDSSISSLQTSSGIYSGGFPFPGFSGGDITLTAQNLSIRDGAEISNLNYGLGNSGQIDLAVNDLIEIQNRSGIGSGSLTFFSGSAGPITIDTGLSSSKTVPFYSPTAFPKTTRPP